MVEAGRDARLAQEAPAEVVLVGEVAGDHLQRHRPFQPEVGGPVDDPHPAAGDQRLDPVAGERGADGGIPHAAVIPPHGGRKRLVSGPGPRLPGEPGADLGGRVLPGFDGCEFGQFEATTNIEQVEPLLCRRGSIVAGLGANRDAAPVG